MDTMIKYLEGEISKCKLELENSINIVNDKETSHSDKDLKIIELVNIESKIQVLVNALAFIELRKNDI